MKANFATVQPWILAHEGGYINHPRDPGGATNQGVTQATYNAWRRAQGLAAQDVRKLSATERDRIYREEYWNVIRGDDLPAGVDYAVYDFAVNSGPTRAARYLQRVVGAKQDGIIGSQTLAATAEHEPEMVVRRLCNDRMGFLKVLSHWPTFGRGWTRRVMGQFEGAQDDDTGVVDRAIKLARDEPVQAPATPAAGKAIGGSEKPQDADPIPTSVVAPVEPEPRPEPAPEPSAPAEKKVPREGIEKAVAATVTSALGLFAAAGFEVPADVSEIATGVGVSLITGAIVWYVRNSRKDAQTIK